VLARIHRYGEWSEGLHTGWENADEDEITPRAATTAFGLTAISEGLIKVLNNASSIVILKEELEGRIAALTLTKILDALQVSWCNRLAEGSDGGQS
jgi:hypothetical protein